MASSASASSQIIESGHSVGSYTLTKEIGKGSFAVVYQGKLQSDAPQETPQEDTVRTARVAIKIVTRKKLTPKLLENLEGEISILRTVRHANIVELIDCLKTSSHIYLIMQYCRMGDLSNYLKTRQRISPLKIVDAPPEADPFAALVDDHTVHPHDGGLHYEFARSFLAQLASALQFMRAKNIVHRDIKPQNLLLQEPEPHLIASGHPYIIPQVKVADFGFARHLEAASLAETLCGSPLYMAPEILRYEKYDAKADLWSVGAVLFEMCVGKPPFRAANHVELLRRIERGEDKIKFPDERSDESLKRDFQKKSQDPNGAANFIRPHVVADDFKSLIRSLLKRRPIERMSFDEFFHCQVLTEYNQALKARTVKPTAPPSSPRVAVRPAPGLPNEGTTSRSGPEVRSTQNASEQEESESRKKQGSSIRIPDAASFQPRYVVGAKGCAPQRLLRDATQVSVRGAKEQPDADGEASSLEDNVLETPGSSVTHLSGPKSLQPTSDHLVSPSGNKTNTVGYDEEKGYVIVEKKNIDVGTAEETRVSKEYRPAWNPLGVVRRPSQLGRLASLTAFSSASPSPAGDASPSHTGSRAVVVQSNNSPHSPSPSPPANHASTARFGTTPPSAPFAIPLEVRRPSFHRRQSQASETLRTASPLNRQQLVAANPASAPSAGVAPGTPFGYANPALGGGSASPVPSTSALTRAISMASIRLFGVPASMSMRGASARRSLRLGLLSSSPTQATADIFSAANSSGLGSVAEQNLLTVLHDYGQKSFVLSEFADAKLAVYFHEGPHQSNYIDRRRASTGSATSALGSSQGRAQFAPVTSTQSPADTEGDVQQGAAEVAACEALILYIKSLSFLQRAIDAVKDYIDAHSGSSGRSSTPFQSAAEIHDTTQWLRAKFNDGYDRASFARSKIADELPDAAQHVDKQILDQALEIARAAAVDEKASFGEAVAISASQSSTTANACGSIERCLLWYETANGLLAALLDPGEECTNLSTAELGITEMYLTAINKRMTHLQRRYELHLSSTPL